jgi:hypothetical protein
LSPRPVSQFVDESCSRSIARDDKMTISFILTDSHSWNKLSKSRIRNSFAMDVVIMINTGATTSELQPFSCWVETDSLRAAVVWIMRYNFMHEFQAWIYLALCTRQECHFILISKRLFHIKNGWNCCTWYPFMAWQQIKNLRWSTRNFKCKIKVYEIKFRGTETNLSYIMFIKTNEQLVCVGSSYNGLFVV